MLIKNIWVSSLVFFVVLNLASCHTANSESLVKWVDDKRNGLTKAIEINNYIVTAKHKPIDYIIYKEYGSSHIPKDSMISRRKDLLGMQYYDITVEIKDSNLPLPEYQSANTQQLQQVLNYYMYGFGDDIVLEEAGRFLPCKLFHFERTFNLTNKSTFVLAFDQEERYADSTKTLRIESAQLPVGILRISFNTEDLSKMRNLK